MRIKLKDNYSLDHLWVEYSNLYRNPQTKRDTFYAFSYGGKYVYKFLSYYYIKGIPNSTNPFLIDKRRYFICG